MDETARDIALGPLAYRLEDGAVRCVTWRGVEILRGLSAPVRDTDWGTLAEEGAAWTHDVGPERAVHERRFALAGGAIAGRMRIEAWAEGRLAAEIKLTAARDIETNRAGFTLLHPLRGVVGTEAVVIRSDGTRVAFRFPKRISPDQPATDIAGLTQTIQGVDVAFAMEGEVFEMEDQRNWSDASFKTYCRPLSRPMPQRIAAGETLRQTVCLTISGRPAGAAAADPAPRSVTMPEILLAVQPGWLVSEFPGNAALLRAAPGLDWSKAALRRLADALRGRPLDVEVVIPEGAAPDAVLGGLASRLAEAGLAARHVIALPEPFLKSHQPGGAWPAGTSPEAAMEAARRAFPTARVGAGMLTNFTELNRRRPDGGAYVTHGNAAIVHAADDTSVLQTLEALPDILASAGAIAGDRPLRLGLVAIAMRSNPYGAGLSANPHGQRVTMTDDDPRQGTAFAAAYAVAVAALAAHAGARAIALGAPSGPFGVVGRPIGAAVAALAALAGARAEIAGTPPGPMTLTAGSRRIALSAADAMPHLEGFE